MVGFLCVVSGKIDFSEFFYGMQLCFDSAPPLAVLRRAIEERVSEDCVVAEGSVYSVADLEILDLRSNLWVNLNSRGQLYSGCHIAAIRDTLTSSCAGPVEISKKPLEQKVLGFAVVAQRIFEALDADNEGVIRLKGMIKALRNDVNYAVDVFAKLDARGVGVVNFQDFMLVYHNTPRSYFGEMQERLTHGGRASGAEGENGEFAVTPVAGASGSLAAVTEGSPPNVPLYDFREALAAEAAERNASALAKQQMEASGAPAPRHAEPPTPHDSEMLPPAPSQMAPSQERTVQNVVDILMSGARKKKTEKPAGSPPSWAKIKGMVQRKKSL